MPKSTAIRSLKLAAGFAIALLALAWAFSDVDLALLARALQSLSLPWLCAAAVSVVASPVLVVVRWWLLLDRPVSGARGKPPWIILWHATIAAQMANIVVPFRLGDSVRVAVASQTLGLGPARAASAAIIERVMDVAVLGLLGASMVWANVVPEWAQHALASKSWLAGAAVTGCVVLVVWLGARRIRFVPSSSAFRWAVAASMIVPLASVLTNFLVLRAFHLTLPMSAAVLLLVVLQVGTSIVAVPGGLGVSQLLTVKTLEIWHVSAPEALALSLVLYAVARVPKLVLLPFAMAAVGRKTVKQAGASTI